MRRVGIAGLAVVASVAAACAETDGGSDSADGLSKAMAIAPEAPSSSSVSAQTRRPQAPVPSPPSPPRAFTLAATGDILLHERLWTQARRDAAETGGATMDFAPQLAGIRPVMYNAGLAICHLETPLAPGDGPYEGYPRFSSPPQIAAALAETGYDACTTASNHTFDQGAAGVDRTLDRLDHEGLAHAGSARSPNEASKPTILKVGTPGGPVAVGLLSFTYGFNGIPYPGGDEWRGNVIDEDEIRDAAAAARNAGAEFVVVSMHWGDEYRHDPSAIQRELAPKLIESDDIDLLLGHHAHVVQPLEKVGGEWIVYGMGNLMAAHRTPDKPRNEGLLVRFTVTEDPESGQFSTTRAEYLPLLQTDAFPVGVVNVAGALDGSAPAGTASQSRLRTARDRTANVVDRLDAIDDGLELLTN